MRLQIAAARTVTALARHARVRVAGKDGRVALHARAVHVVLVSQADRRGELLRLRRLELLQGIDVSGVRALVGEDALNFRNFLFLVPRPLLGVIVAVQTFIGSDRLKPLGRRRGRADK